MTLQDFISQNTGKIVGSGQCGELVDLYLVQVYNNTTEYPSAKDYWFNGIPSFSVTTSPQPGDIAVYNAHPGFPDGHIAIYVGNGEVFEQNADPDGSPPHIFPRANTYLLGYLTQGEDMPNDGDVINVYNLMGETAQPADITAYTSKPWNAPDGLFYGKIQIDVQNLQNDLKAAESASYTPVTETLYTKN